MAETKDAAVIVAYGANLTPPGVTPSQAYDTVVKSLEAKGVAVLCKSKLWRSQAWPDASDPPYFNAVIIVKSPWQAPELLALLHRLEHEAGRRRDGARYAPRPLDLDLIAYGRLVQDGDLVLPHLRAHERGFVMGPLAEIMPDWRHPVSGRTAAELYREVSIGQDAAPI